MKRQGDLLFLQIEKIPAGESVEGGLILRGEATGHSHRLDKGTVIRTKDGRIFLRTIKGSRVVHEEHREIKLEPGLWAVVRQREYSGKDMIRLVID